MLDVAKLDESLKLRALGRLINSNHPFMEIVRRNLDLESFFNPRCINTIDSLTARGVALLKKDRDSLWAEDRLDRQLKLIESVRETSLKEIVKPRGQTSIPFFYLWRRGARKIKDITMADFRTLRRHVEEVKHTKIEIAISTNIPAPIVTQHNLLYFVHGAPTRLDKLTSKEIRKSRSSSKPIVTFKIGLNLTDKESLSWGHRLSKLTSTKHRDILLKVAHGDVYTQDKLFRFGMVDNNKCPRCNLRETLQHKFLECDYVTRIWSEVNKYYLSLNSNITQNQQLLMVKNAFAAELDHNLVTMTLSAEVLTRILYLKNNQTYLIHPKHLVKQVIKALSIKEQKQSIKEKFIELLNEPERE